VERQVPFLLKRVAALYQSPLFANPKLSFSTEKGVWKSIKADDGAAGYGSGLMLLLLLAM
jgi:hypothetical protein